jgi:hypothetical protein
MRNSRKPRFNVGDLLRGDIDAPFGRYIVITKVDSRPINSLYHFREIANNKSEYWVSCDIERFYDMIG